MYRGFLNRLVADGGEKIIKLETTLLHLEYSRFIKICSDIKGLSLNDALLELAWNQKQTSKRAQDSLKEFIIVAKESGFDLEKTFVADAYIKKDEGSLSNVMIKKYLKGRGRYGATPHAKVALFSVVLQERSRPFDFRLADPLEPIKARLRARQVPFTKTATELYQQSRIRRPVKALFC